MKKTLSALTLAMLFAAATLASAQAPKTLLDQNTFAQSRRGSKSALENFVLQWTNSHNTWAGIYGDAPDGVSGWIPFVGKEYTADMDIEIEVDIEQYYAETIQNNKVYFHWADPTASDLPKTAQIDGSFISNNGQYLGLDFSGTTKEIKPDGTIKNGMVMKNDVLGRAASANGDPKAFDIKFTLAWNGINGTVGTSGGFVAPSGIGAGDNGSVNNAAWWVINGGKSGNYAYSWKVELITPAGKMLQDGHYEFDPRVISTPAL